MRVFAESRTSKLEHSLELTEEKIQVVDVEDAGRAIAWGHTSVSQKRYRKYGNSFTD